MVEDIINYVSSNWVAWVFAAGYAVLIAMLKKERTQNKALREGVQALLRQEIIDFCRGTRIEGARSMGETGRGKSIQSI